MKSRAPGLAWSLLLAASASQAAVFTVSNANDQGTGSFRQAILDANDAPGRDRIVFSLPGTGIHTLSPTSALPQITEEVDVDGTSQPGYAGLPLIELEGSRAGTDVSGLLLLSGGCTVRGLAVNRFSRDGIRIEGLGTNVIQGNLIGTDPTGKLARGNAEGGVTLFQSPGNRLGGTGAGEGNLISGGNLSGVYIVGAQSVGNRLEGNRIGTDIAGAAALGNQQNGVVLSEAVGNDIGGAEPGAGNTLSGNGQSGVYFLGRATAFNRVRGNRIGTSQDGLLALGNASDGVTVNGAASNLIGGTVALAANVISANRGNGVQIAGASAVGNQVLGNRIGTDALGAQALSNTFAGVLVAGVTGNIIGSPTGRNLISGNGQSGVALVDSASNNVVQGNWIGVADAGDRPLGNGYDGIVVQSPANLIGGAAPGAGNLVSGNTGNGVRLVGNPASDNRIEGNWIGLDATGQSAIGNRVSGVQVEEAASNRIGGLAAGAGNVISGNVGTGVYLLGTNTQGNRIQGNRIGTDPAGTQGLPNLHGIGLVDARTNSIGGVVPEARNLISASYGRGIYAMGTAAGLVIQGNYIGTDVSGTAALGNQGGGVYLYGTPGVIIGGTAPGAGNLISANRKVAISIGDPGATDIAVLGNSIGLAADGRTPLGNQWHGIEILNGAGGVTVGGDGPGAANRIASAQNAGYDGVRIRTGCARILVRANEIFGNAGLGIDLGDDGPGPNGTEADGGANRNQSAPVLSAAAGRFLTVIRGVLDSAPNRVFTLDFYGNSEADPSGYGEAERWIGARTLTTSASGHAAFEFAFTNRTAQTGSICATATDPNGNTSELSLCLSNAVSALTDTDGDGLPDAYEVAWGFDPKSKADAALDADGDGLSNLREYLAGTDPRQAMDALKLALLRSPGGRWLLQFPTVAGKYYHVEAGDSPTGPWRAVCPALLGTGQDLQCDAGFSSNANRAYYRLWASDSLDAAQDSDGDGMPDAYETTWSFDPHSSLDGAADADADGLTNAQEYWAGTNPRDAADSLRLTVARTATGWALEFPSVAGKRYRLEFASSPTSEWTSLASDLTGTGEVLRYEDTTALGPARCYRVVCFKP